MDIFTFILEYKCFYICNIFVSFMSLGANSIESIEDYFGLVKTIERFREGAPVGSLDNVLRSLEVNLGFLKLLNFAGVSLAVLPDGIINSFTEFGNELNITHVVPSDNEQGDIRFEYEPPNSYPAFKNLEILPRKWYMNVFTLSMDKEFSLDEKAECVWYVYGRGHIYSYKFLDELRERGFEFDAGKVFPVRNYSNG